MFSRQAREVVSEKTKYLCVYIELEHPLKVVVEDTVPCWVNTAAVTVYLLSLANSVPVSEKITLRLSPNGPTFQLPLLFETVSKYLLPSSWNSHRSGGLGVKISNGNH